MFFEKAVEVFQGFFEAVFFYEDHALLVEGDHEVWLGLKGVGEGGEGAVALSGEA